MKKINTLQFCSCFIMLFLSPFMGIEIYSLIKYSKLNIFFTLILSFLISLILMYIFTTIFDYKPKYNIKEKLNTLFNKYISIILTIILSICFLLIGIILNYDLNNFIISQFLSETPIYIIAFLFSLLFFYINSKGFEAIIKVSTILLFINIFIFILMFLSQIKGFNLSNFKPIIINTKDIFKSLIYALLSPTITFMLLLIPKNIIVANNKTNKNIYKSLIISYLTIFIITILTIGILSINLASLYQYPSYMYLKNLSFLDTLDRIENIIIINWIFELFISISLIINFISKLTKIRHFIVNIILFSALLSIKNNTLFYDITLYILPYIIFTIIFIFIIIFIKIKRKNKSFL